METPEDVPAADHDGGLDIEVVDRPDFLGEPLQDCGLDAVALLAGERLAGELQEDAFEAGRASLTDLKPHEAPDRDLFAGLGAHLGDEVPTRSLPLASLM